MAARRSRKNDIDDRLADLKVQARRAKSQEAKVKSREPEILSFRDEMREMRNENHFTQLFWKTIGGTR